MIRNFAKNLEGWLKNAMTGVPDEMIKTKARFCCHSTFNLGVNFVGIILGNFRVVSRQKNKLNFVWFLFGLILQLLRSNTYVMY
jgi:hypothetical protein